MKNSRIIARFGMIIALIIAAYFTDDLVSKPFPVRMAVATLVVVMTLCQLFDYGTAVFTTTVFGLISLVFAYIFWKPFSSPYFTQVQISVLPRMMIGVVSYGVFILTKKLFAKGKTLFVKEMLPSSIAAACGVLTNTSLVLLMMAIAKSNNYFDLLFKTIIATNFIVEIISVIIVVPLLSVAVKRGLKNTDILS